MKHLDTFAGSIVRNGMVPVCLNRKSDNKKVIINGCNYNLEDYPKEEYTPIGIVVMNPLHTNARYQEGDPNKGKYLIMSLKNMDYNNVENGTAMVKPMIWGCITRELDKLYEYNKVPVIKNTENEEHVNDYLNYSFLPTTFDNKYGKCITAPKLGYYYMHRIPSPYTVMADETDTIVWGVNPLYTEGGKEENNALSDFDGKKNTEFILSEVRDEFKNCSAIPNSEDDGSYPAATCCARFRTDGTNSGDWWLPSCGELGYCSTFYEQNAATLKYINKVYGEDICATDLKYSWSSTQVGYYDVKIVGLYDGCVDYAYKLSHGCTRAVCSVNTVID